jgi:hypothetical protein
MSEQGTFNNSRAVLICGLLACLLAWIGQSVAGVIEDESIFLLFFIMIALLSLSGIVFFIKGFKEKNTIGKWLGLALCLLMLFISSIVILMLIAGVH